MKLRSLLIILVCFLTFSVWGVLAVLYLPNGNILESANNGYATPQTTSKEITLADGSCRNITSTTNTQYFIPTNSMGQSDAFIAHPPAGVSVGSCAPQYSCNWTREVIRSCASLEQKYYNNANLAWDVPSGNDPGWNCLLSHSWSYWYHGISTWSPCIDFWYQCRCSTSSNLNNCSTTFPSCNWTSCSLTTGTPTSVNQAWSTVGISCKINCTGGYTGNDCLTPPVWNSCAASPACIAAWNCTVTANAPTSANQAWSNGWAQCGYTCSGGWSGQNCEVSPAVCFDARQYSVWRHCDIWWDGWWWIDSRTGRRDTSPYLFGRPGYAWFIEFDINGLWFMDTTTNYDAALCKNGASPIQSGDYGYSCPAWSIAYWWGCYYPNTDPRRPTECDSADPADECCFFECPATPTCTAGTCGSANGTTVRGYPSLLQLCTSGNIQNIDSIAADGIYNWGCGSTSCSANRDNTTWWWFCLGIALPRVVGGRGPRCIGGNRICDQGSAWWQCWGTGWVWDIRDNVCAPTNGSCQ